MAILMKKTYWQRPLMAISGVVMAFAIIAPAQAQTITKPTRNRTTATFTISEHANGGVLSGSSLSMNHSADIHYAIGESVDTAEGDYAWWNRFDANNQNKNPNSNVQPVTISYDDNNGHLTANYENAPPLNKNAPDGLRGYKMVVSGCPNLPGVIVEDHCETIEITIKVTDVSELNTMSGSIKVTADTANSTVDTAKIGNTLTADFSDIRDQEGVNNLSVRWSRQACTASRGLDRWNVGQTVGYSDTYELTLNDANQPVTVWGQYQTDTNNYKWVCKDVLGLVNAPPPVINEYPIRKTTSKTYNLDENAARTIGEDLAMKDPENEVISYSIVDLSGDPIEEAALRSVFKVRNTDPNLVNDTDGTGYQPIELSSKINFDYENTPVHDDSRGYQFGIEGCDPDDQCRTITVTVNINDLTEISLSSGQIVITGQVSVGTTLTADFSGFSDPEASEEGIESLHNGSGNIIWRLGACTATYGIGSLPTTQSSGDPYKQLEDYSQTYTIKPVNIGQIISVWGSYNAATGDKKWVCKQTRAVGYNSSLPYISISSSHQSVTQGEEIEVTLQRTNANLASSLIVKLRRNQSLNNTSVTFTETFPANQNQVTFEVKAWKEGENLKVEVLPGEGYNHLSASVTVTVTPPNQGPGGSLTITGTAQVGETLTADTSGITDGNGISGGFSYYTWWKQIDFGPNADVEEQISGARSSTYQIRREDVRAKIWAKVHYTDNDGFNERRTSDFTAKVIPATDEAPYVLSMHLVDNRGSFVDPGSRIEVSEGHSFDVRVFMSKRVTGITSLHYAPRMRLNIGGQTRILPWYINSQCNFNSPGSCASSTSELKFFHNVEAGDTGSITFPTNGMFMSNGQGDTNPTPPSGANFIGTDLNYPRKNLGYVTVLASQNQVIEESEEPETPTPPPVESNVTASFQDLPVEHDGSSQFTFQLNISEPLRPRSKKSIKDALTVTHGSIRSVRKVNDRSNWNITVEPSSTAAVNISFAPKTDCSDVLAPCTSDDRAVSSLLSAQVMGPAMISISDASAYENTDTSISFSVTLNRPATQPVTVDWATADGTATAGLDYTAASGTLTFAVGENTKTITVNLLNDSIDEGSETFLVNLSNVSGGQISDNQGVGTINNTDAMPGAWISRFGRTVGSQVMDAVSSRMGNFSSENRVVIGGIEMSNEKETNGINQQNLQEPFESNWWNWDDQNERGANNRTMTLEDLANGTSFNIGMENESTGSTWSAWGKFANDRFEGEADDVNLEGKVTSGLLGADLASGNWRGGIAVSSSKGEGTFNPHDQSSVGGEVESSLTSVFPYLGYEFGENKALWGILGLGEGDVTVSQRDQSIKTDTSMRMGALGAKGPILSQSEGDEIDMTLQTDGLYVRMNSDATTGMESSETEVTRLRLMVDSFRNFKIGEGTLTPSFQLGVRHDGGDAEEGMGVEAGSGVRYEVGGLTLEAEARKLLVHEESNYEEWGASAAVRIDPGQSGRGLNLSISPAWGDSSSGINHLWSAKGAHLFGKNDDFEAGNRLEAEIGYGIWNPVKKLFGIVTPYFGLSIGDENRVTRTGTRWNISPNANLRLELSRTKGENKENDDKAIGIQGGIQW